MNDAYALCVPGTIESGLHFDAVIGAVIASAAKRHRIKDSTRSKGKPTRKGPLKVGFTFNVKRIKPTFDASVNPVGSERPTP